MVFMSMTSVCKLLTTTVIVLYFGINVTTVMNILVFIISEAQKAGCNSGSHKNSNCHQEQQPASVNRN